MKQSQPCTHLESLHLLQRGTFLYSYSLSLLNFLKRLQLFNAWVCMSKCLTRLFHYVEQYIPLPELRKYISFILAHYSLWTRFSSIILTTWILTAPESLSETHASLQTPFFLETSLSSLMSFLGRNFIWDLCLPLEAGCQHTIYNTNCDVLKYTWFTGPFLKDNVWLCRLMAISTGELVVPVLC